MSITPTNQTIIIHNSVFDEKTFIRFKIFNEKITKLHHFFKKLKLRLKKVRGPN